MLNNYIQAVALCNWLEMSYRFDKPSESTRPDYHLVKKLGGGLQIWKRRDIKPPKYYVLLAPPIVSSRVHERLNPAPLASYKEAVDLAATRGVKIKVARRNRR